jgi:hypothetical protein
VKRPSSHSGRVRWVTLAILAGGCLSLVPWIGYLAQTLPDQFATGQWRLAWVGFDIALLCLWGAAAVLGWRRHAATVPVLAATAALMCCDAWFDVMLDWRTADWLSSVALAVLVEVPVAALLLRRARQLLLGGQVTRRLTIADIDLHTDPTARRVLDALHKSGAAASETLATATGLPRDHAQEVLNALHDNGYLGRTRDGRWRLLPLDLRWPDAADLDPATRDRYLDYLDAKLGRELRVFARAAAQHEQLGPWAKGSRGTAYLTEAELSRFEAEYLDLLSRYALRHDTPSSQVRAVALRFYAFPQSLVDEEDRETNPLPRTLTAPATG